MKNILLVLVLSLMMFTFTPVAIAQLNSVQHTSYNSPNYSITVPSGLEESFDKERNTVSFENDNVWIFLTHFALGDLVIEDRDEYLNEVVIPAQKNQCESLTMENDERECTYQLLDAYKTSLHDNNVLVVFDQKDIRYSLESNEEDKIQKCYTDTVIVDTGIWMLVGCIEITNQQATNPFIGLSGGMALNVLRESLNSFEPLDAYSTSFSELIEKYDLKIADFIDFSKTPQYYIDRYENESEYRNWFDRNYEGITVHTAVGFPKDSESQDILKELGYLHTEIIEKEEEREESDSSSELATLKQKIEELNERIESLESTNTKLQNTIDDLKEKLNDEGISTSKTKKEIASFVDESKDPQEYVDRYNNEESYKEWFDENYSDYDSIYEAVGKREPVPDWVKNNVVWWSEGKLSEDDFVNGIEFLVKNGIIKVD